TKGGAAIKSLDAGPFGAVGGGPSWQQQVLAKGWGYAILIPTSVQADNGAGLTRGIIGLCNKGQPRKPDDWGALRAWAWGASRALDYFVSDKAVDAKQVGIEGLSRYGKAALVASHKPSRPAPPFRSGTALRCQPVWRRQPCRALDYFVSDKAVDAKQVGIEGLSRYGKAALVATAYDSRFAIAFIGSSGAGGAKILRRNFGEQVENIASTAEYH